MAILNMKRQNLGTEKKNKQEGFNGDRVGQTDLARPSQPAGRTRPSCQAELARPRRPDWADQTELTRPSWPDRAGWTEPTRPRRPDRADQTGPTRHLDYLNYAGTEKILGTEKKNVRESIGYGKKTNVIWGVAAGYDYTFLLFPLPKKTTTTTTTLEYF